MDEKKSFFEKFKLIDRVEKDNSSQQEDTDTIENIDVIDTDNKIEDKDIKMDNKSFNELPEVNEEIQNNNGGAEANRLFTVEEIYSTSSLNNQKINTIFLIDSYVKALPENLPTEIKKQAVLNIIKASDMNVDTLLKDGQDRLSILNKFITDVTNKTENIVRDREEDIKELYKKIQEFKELIENRQRFQEEQKAYIDYEFQRIQSIIDFIK